jgi:hypothetical protein
MAEEKITPTTHTKRNQELAKMREMLEKFHPHSQASHEDLKDTAIELSLASPKRIARPHISFLVAPASTATRGLLNRLPLARVPQPARTTACTLDVELLSDNFVWRLGTLFGAFLSSGAGLTANVVPMLPAQVARRILDDPRNIPYLLVWKSDYGEVKEAVRVIRLGPPPYLPTADSIEVKRTDGSVSHIRAIKRPPRLFQFPWANATLRSPLASPVCHQVV